MSRVLDLYKSLENEFAVQIIFFAVYIEVHKKK